ncbi:MAG: TlpA family protein disulfide reductase, partial [Acidobacteria bacterium]|nr:TlpA family protein disulfide reductase [Acidobacteriota bacterium]
SCFDGGHAFLFHAQLQPDGTLAGSFWSRDTYHATWTARRASGDADTEMPDPLRMVTLTNRAGRLRFRFPDLDGRPVSLADERFQNKVVLVNLFGSWCPNCNDATAYLVELDERFRERGLSIVGLAFEMTGDFSRDAEQVRVYRDYHGIEYPLLIAGTADKTAASKAFPLIERVKSFPTTIFMDGDGNVHMVYSGFSGPATGEAYTRLQTLFESTIEEILGDE